MSEFGTTAWGRPWLRLAEPVTLTRPNPSLPKARSLARRDRVGDLSLDPGRITATVHDSRSRRVELGFSVWSSPPSFATPDLSEDLVDRLAGDGTPIAPALDDLHAACECADRSGRCRHVLAVLFETARRVDETPEAALRLRGAESPALRVDHDRIPITDLDPTTFWTSSFSRPNE